jgi:cell division septal protein FtsQ
VGRVAARRRTTARIAVLPARRGLPEVGDLMPSGRSVALGVLILALAVGGWVAARQTSVFAVRAIDVRGGNAAVRAEVAAALADERGASLLSVDGTSIGRRLAALPDVRSFTFDRAFPHTLRVVVRREVPVLVVRRVPGADAFLVGASGMVIRLLPHPRLSSLPRLWVKKTVPLAAGQPLPPSIQTAAAALAAARGAALPGGIATVRVGEAELALVLGGGLEVRLGDAGDLRLKLAIARRILHATGAALAGVGYIDVAVPERPVVSAKSQVGG